MRPATRSSSYWFIYKPEWSAIPGNGRKKSTGDPVLCFFRVFYIEISTKCSLLCLSYSLEEGSLGLSGRRVIFEDKGGNA